MTSFSDEQRVLHKTGKKHFLIVEYFPLHRSQQNELNRKISPKRGKIEGNDEGREWEKRGGGHRGRSQPGTIKDFDQTNITCPSLKSLY